MEPESKRELSPTRFPSPFTIRGFLALSTFSKAVALLFVCCVFVLFKAFLGVGHSAESCGVYAHEVTYPGHRPGSASGGSGAGLDTNDPRLRTKDGTPRGDEQTHVWLERVEEMYEYEYDWKLGEHEVEHNDGDRYDDEYEHEDFLDTA